MSDAKPIVVPLSKPWTLPDGDVTMVLEMREPVAADFMALDHMPVTINLARKDFEPVFHPSAMSAFIGRLAGQPPSFVGKLPPSDWVAAAWAVVPFFVPGSAPAPSAAPSSSP